MLLPESNLVRPRRTIDLYHFLVYRYLNLKPFYFQCRSLIGYAIQQCTLVNELAAASLRFQSLFEDDLDKVFND